MKQELPQEGAVKWRDGYGKTLWANPSSKMYNIGLLMAQAVFNNGMWRTK